MFNLFKFLHIVASIVWIGGTFTLVVINTRLSRSQNWPAVQALSEQGAFYGRAILGPAAGLTLIAGIVAAIYMRVSFGALWITWGFAGIILSMVLGMVFIRRTTADIIQLTTTANPDQAALTALQGRLANLNLINLLLLLSVVAAMVFKPTL